MYYRERLTNYLLLPRGRGIAIANIMPIRWSRSYGRIASIACFKRHRY